MITQRGCDLPDRGALITDVVQRHRCPHEVDAIQPTEAARQLRHTGSDPCGNPGDLRPLKHRIDHRLRGVDGDNLGLGQQPGQLDRGNTGARSDVEHPTYGMVEQGDHLRDEVEGNLAVCNDPGNLFRPDECLVGCWLVVMWHVRS